jgi:hypothetical protein
MPMYTISSCLLILMECYSTLCNKILRFIMCVKDLMDMMMKNGDMGSQYLQSF